LRVGWCEIYISYTQFATVSSESFVVELETIVQDKSVWYAKSRDNISPNEPLHVLILDIREGFSFNPFGEIISLDKEPSMVSNCFWEWPNNI